MKTRATSPIIILFVIFSSSSTAQYWHPTFHIAVHGDTVNGTADTYNYTTRGLWTIGDFKTINSVSFGVAKNYADPHIIAVCNFDPESGPAAVVFRPPLSHRNQTYRTDVQIEIKSPEAYFDIRPYVAADDFSSVCKHHDRSASPFSLIIEAVTIGSLNKKDFEEEPEVQMILRKSGWYRSIVADRSQVSRYFFKFDTDRRGDYDLNLCSDKASLGNFRTAGNFSGSSAFGFVTSFGIIHETRKKALKGHLLACEAWSVADNYTEALRVEDVEN